MAIDEYGESVQVTNDDDEEMDQGKRLEGEEEAPMQFRGGHDKFHVSRKAIGIYGPTNGCPAYTSIEIKGTSSGRVGIIHNDNCRERESHESHEE